MRERLVERAGEGDDVAFSKLIDLDGDRCYAIAYRILRDAERAQDAVQQALLLAWRELPKMRNAVRFEVWLHRLLVNACYEESRRYRRWSANVRPLPVDGPGTADETVTLDDRKYLEWSVPTDIVVLGDEYRAEGCDDGNFLSVVAGEPARVR